MEEIRPKRELDETPEEAALRLEEEHRDHVSTEIADQLRMAYRAVSELLETRTDPKSKLIH